MKHRSPIERNRKARAVNETASTLAPLEADEPAVLNREIRVWPVENLPHLKLEHLGATIGTVVHGLDVADVSDAEVAFLASLLEDRKVVFFRDQTCSEKEHIAFAARFGELEIHPFNPMHPDHDEIIPIYSGESYAGGANQWHSDVMWRMDPSVGSVLRAHTVPSVGGDTLFADMTAAYRGLPQATKERVDGLMAINAGTANGSKEQARKRLEQRGASQTELEEFDVKYADVPIPVHPVVRTHPRTGERALYVTNGFTTRIVGMTESESDELLAQLYSQAAIPEYQCRFKWEPGSIAFWDNRSAQHYASSDYWPQRREMDRVTIAGDLPFFRDDDGHVVTSYPADKALLG